MEPKWLMIMLHSALAAFGPPGTVSQPMPMVRRETYIVAR